MKCTICYLERCRNFLSVFLVVVAGGFWQLSAIAGTLIKVNNPDSGQTVFTVATNFDPKEKEQEWQNGIYGVYKNGNSGLLISGKVLGATANGFNGILSQTLFGSKTSGTVNAWAVVDGKLALFSRNAKDSKDAKTSTLLLGEEGLEIFDPNINLALSKIPRINAIDDLAIFESEQFSNYNPSIKGMIGPYQHSQLLILSIKAPHSLGTGYTVALVMVANGSEGDTPKVVRNRAVILSYDFFSDQELGRFIIYPPESNKSSYEWRGLLYSDIYLRSLIHRFKSMEKNPLIQEWSKYMERYLAEGSNRGPSSSLKNASEKDQGQGKGIPLLSLVTEERYYKERPLLKIADLFDETGLYQRYDPDKNVWDVVRTSSDNLTSAEIVGGPKKKSKYHLYFEKEGQGQGQFQIVATGKVLTDEKGNFLFKTVPPLEREKLPAMLDSAIGDVRFDEISYFSTDAGDVLLLPTIGSKFAFLPTAPQHLGLFNNNSKVSIIHKAYGAEMPSVKSKTLTHLVVISTGRKNSRGKTGDLWCLLFSESDDTYLQQLQQLYFQKFPFFTPHELELRTFLRNGFLVSEEEQGFYFDNDSSPNSVGQSNYLQLLRDENQRGKITEEKKNATIEMVDGAGTENERLLRVKEYLHVVSAKLSNYFGVGYLQSTVYLPPLFFDDPSESINYFQFGEKKLPYTVKGGNENKMDYPSGFYFRPFKVDPMKGYPFFTAIRDNGKTNASDSLYLFARPVMEMENGDEQGGANQGKPVLSHFAQRVNNLPMTSTLTILPVIVGGETTSDYGFSLLYHLSRVGLNRGAEYVNRAMVPLSIPYEAILGISSFRGLGNQSGLFYTIISVGRGTFSSSPKKGTYVISGKVTPNGTALENFQQKGPALSLTTDNKISRISERILGAGEINDRMRADSEGFLYWLDNPELANDDPQFTLRKLTNPSVQLRVRDLRANSVSMRFEDKLEILGSTTAGQNNFDVFGRWMVADVYDLRKHFPKYYNYITALSQAQQKKEKRQKDKESGGPTETKDVEDKNEKDDKSGEKYPTFLTGQNNQMYSVNSKNATWHRLHVKVTPYWTNFWNEVASGPRSAEQMHIQILLNDREKAQYTNDLFYQFQFGAGPFSINNEKINVYRFDPTSTVKESMMEFEAIKHLPAGTRPIVLVNIEDLLAAGPFIQSLGDRKPEENSSPQSKIFSRLLLLASEGRYANLDDLSKLGTDFSPSISIVMIGSQKEWSDLRATLQEEEVRYKLLDRFKVNDQFMSSSWTQFPPKHALTPEAELKDYLNRPVTTEEREVFPQIEALLNQAADGKLKGKQIILAVPQKLKNLIENLIMSRWSNDNYKRMGQWNFHNPNMVLYRLRDARDKNTQSQIIENFDSMRGNASSGRNVVFLADLEDVNKIGRPHNGEGKIFVLQDPLEKMRKDAVIDLQDRQPIEDKAAEVAQNGEEAKKDDGSEEDEEIEKDIELKGIAPHLIWWIAAKGEKIRPKAHKNWSLASETRGDFATIIVATTEELEQLDQTLAFESMFVNFHEHFQIIGLTAPSDKVKYNLVKSLFEGPEIASLGYSFQLDGVTDLADAEHQLIYHFVNRVEGIANQLGLEPTVTFVRAFSELKHTIKTSLELKRYGVLDKQFLNRFFFKIFNLPVDPDSLTKDDYLLKVKNVRRFAEDMRQKYRYFGPYELKEVVLNNIWSQTRPSRGKKIPNSQVWYGSSSRGKTYMFEVLVKMLGLIPYDPQKSNNEEASYIIIPCKKLVESKNNDTDITLSEAISRVEDLLSQPNGHRAWILFDDAHEIKSSKVKREFFAFLNRLTDAENGIIRVKNRKGEFFDVTVQALNLMLTVNPPADNEIKRRFVDEKDANDLINLVVASLSSTDYALEQSNIYRFGDVVNFDKHPYSAQVPAILQDVRAFLELSVFVDPYSIDAVVKRFPKGNSRNLTSPAATALTKVPDLVETAPLYIVVPREKLRTDVNSAIGGEFIGPANIERAVRELTQVIPIKKDRPDSLLRLVDFLLLNFRTYLYNQLILTAHNTDILRIERPGLYTLYKMGFIHSMVSHLLLNPHLTPAEFKIAPQDWNFLSRIEVQHLFEEHAKIRSDAKKFLPLEISGRVREKAMLNSFLNAGDYYPDDDRFRGDVLVDYQQQLVEIGKEIMHDYLRLDTTTMTKVMTWNSKEIAEWFHRLQGDPQESYKKYMEKILEVYISFLQDFDDPSLVELKDVTADNQFYTNEKTRLFGYVLDSALAKLPWGVVVKFMFDIVEQAKDLSLGPKPIFQDYMRSHEISPFGLSSPDFLFETYSEGAKIKKSQEEDQQLRNKCEGSLTKKIIAESSEVRK